VGSLSAHLLRRGLLVELGAGPSRGGRRPSRMQFNARYGVVAGIDIGPTRTRLGVADLRGDLLARRIVLTPQEKDPGALLDALAADTRNLLREIDVSSVRLLAVGAGAPGVVDPRRGMAVEFANNLSGWSQVPMATVLRNALGAPVVVENDVNLAILGEHWKGAARGHETCVFLSFGTGVGGGIMVNGQLHHGHHYLAGEIGLMSMGPQYVDTNYGPRGCLETLTGLAALKSRWHASAADSQDWVPDLFRAASAGDACAQRIIHDAATYIGIAAANVASVLDPSLIVLGGALIAQGEPILDQVREIVARIIPTPPSIVASSLDKDAPLFGSLLVATTEARERVKQQLR
jgi:glucokinase